MYELKNILACTDLSSPARCALDRAAMIAAESSARLHLVTVMSTGWLEPLQARLQGAGDDVGDRLRTSTRQRLDELVEALRLTSRGAVVGQLLEGPAIQTLLDAADRIDADLIVVGARGAGFLRHAVLGSTAERMIRKATCPILVVKQVPHVPYRRTLLALDFSPVAHRVMQTARVVARGSRRLPLHAFELLYEGKMQYAGVAEATIHRYREAARAEAAAQLDEILRDARADGQMSSAILPHGNAVQCILEFEQELDCDLIAIGKQGESKFEELLIGSVTKHVLSRSQADVLIAV